MDQEIISNIKYISSKLTDLESLPLPWSDVERASFHLEWLDGVLVMNYIKLKASIIGEEYKNLANRYRALEPKIKELGLEYPEIE